MRKKSAAKAKMGNNRKKSADRTRTFALVSLTLYGASLLGACLFAADSDGAMAVHFDASGRADGFANASSFAAVETAILAIIILSLFFAFVKIGRLGGKSATLGGTLSNPSFTSFAGTFISALACLNLFYFTKAMEIPALPYIFLAAGSLTLALSPLALIAYIVGSILSAAENR